MLLHAAAGGVGQIAAQWLSSLGVTVIGTAGGPEKCALAKAAGCAHVIDYAVEPVAPRVQELTGGAGVPVVFDGVGAATFEASLDCLQPRGLLVSYGNASGPVANVNLGVLAQKGSLFVTRPTLFHYTDTREALLGAAEDLFAAMASGAVTPRISATYPLEDAATAHRDLEARRTTGSILLKP